MVIKGKIASTPPAGNTNKKSYSSSSSSSSSSSKKELKRSSTISTIPKHQDHDHQLHRRPKRTCSSNSVSPISSKSAGPVSKSRKKATTTSTEVAAASLPKLKPIRLKIDVDFDKQFDKQGEEDEVFWLSSGSMSPLYKFYDDFSKFISPWDLICLNEQLVCDSPALSKGGGGGLGSSQSSPLGGSMVMSFFDGSRVNPLEEASIALHEEAFDGGSITEDDTCSSLLSGDLDEAACVISIVPLIDLDGEEDTEKWVLSSNMEAGDLDEDFPSPTFNTQSKNGAGAAKSSDHNGNSSSSIKSSQNGRGSVSIRIHLGKKKVNLFGRRNHALLSTSLSASKLIEFKRGHHKNNLAASSPRTIAKRPLRFGSRKSAQHHRFLSPKLENDVQVLLLNEESIPPNPAAFFQSHHKTDVGDDPVVTANQKQNTSTALSCSNTDSSSPFWDFNRTGMWVSLLNLDGVDSKWISSSSSEMDDHELEESNFPSPTKEKTLNSEPISSEQLSRTTEQDNMECDDDKPLFWPFDKSTASDWRLALDYFCLSPQEAGKARKNIGFGSQSDSDDANADHSDINTSGSVRSSRLLQHRKRLNLKAEGSKRRQLVLVSSLTTSKMVDFKRGRARKNNVTANKSKIKALSLSIGDSSAITISCGFQYLKLWKKFNSKAQDSMGRQRMLLEEDEFCFKDQQLSIERVVGLDEFDGHEGMDHMEFNNLNDFSVLRYLDE